MKKLWQNIEKFLGVYRWHPKIALRYLPIVDEIKKYYRYIPEILEVGPGELGIAPYIGTRVVGVDIHFNNELLYPLLVPVKSSVLDLPFSNNSFEVVVSVDMLEHIKQEDRAKAISEMLRIAKRLVCIGVPCGELAEKQDRELAGVYKKKYKQDFRFLTEQVSYGLPTRDVISDTIESEAEKLHKRVIISSHGNINLSLRKFLMQGWMSRNIFVNILFRKVFLLFIPIFRIFNHEPAYRQLFMVIIKP